MSDLKIICNNKPRHVLTWHDLTESERAEFDYLSDNDRELDASFARYRGWVYDLGEFMKTPDELKPFHRYASDSFFSGTLCRFVNHGDSVIMGRYYS